MRYLCQAARFDYHQWVLELLEESRWQLVPIDDYRAQKINALNVSQPDSSTIDVSGEDVSGENEPPTQVDQSTVATIDRPSIPPANELTLPEATPNAIASSDTAESDQSASQTDESVEETPPTALAHNEIKLLCNYALRGYVKISCTNFI